MHPICAYIDPGTGSLVLQVLVGGILAGLLAIKMFWQKIKRFVSKLAGRNADEAESGQAESEKHEDGADA